MNFPKRRLISSNVSPRLHPDQMLMHRSALQKQLLLKIPHTHTSPLSYTPDKLALKNTSVWGVWQHSMCDVTSAITDFPDRFIGSKLKGRQDPIRTLWRRQKIHCLFQCNASVLSNNLTNIWRWNNYLKWVNLNGIVNYCLYTRWNNVCPFLCL